MKIKDPFKNKYWAFILFGLGVRLFFFLFFVFRGYINIDETMTMLNCKYLINYGTDAFGQTYPIYFNTWGIGGMSPLPVYVSALSCKIFGLHYCAMRLPQFIVSCFSFVTESLIFKKLFGDKAKYGVLFLSLTFGPLTFAIYELDCWWVNFFLVFGFYLFLLFNETKKKKFLYLSTCILSLSFYCYGLAFLIVPPLLLSLYIYQLKLKNIKFRDAIFNAVLLTVLAFPYIVFGLVFAGIIDPFKLGSITFPSPGLYSRAEYVFGTPILSRVLSVMSSLSFYDYSAELLSISVGFLTPLIGLLFYVATGKYKMPRITNKEFYIPFLITAFIFCVFSSSSFLNYRYGSIEFILSLLLMPVIFKIGEHPKIKVIFTAALILILAPVFLVSSYQGDAYLKAAENVDAPVEFYCPVDETSLGREDRQPPIAFLTALQLNDIEEFNFKEKTEEIINANPGDTVYISDNYSVISEFNYDSDSNIIIIPRQLSKTQMSELEKTLEEKGFKKTDTINHLAIVKRSE